MALLGAGPLALVIDLVPRLGTQDIMNVLDALVLPDDVVYSLPPQSL